MIKIVPAILVSELSELKRQLANAGEFVDEADIDIIDWGRTPKKTVTVNEALTVNTELTLNFDLMMDYPSKVLPELVRYEKVQRVIVNLESKDDIGDIMNFLESHDTQTGISLNPENSIDEIEYLLPHIDLVQIFTIEPGAQGNKFIPKRLKLIKELRKSGFDGLIETDGGFNINTLPIFAEYDFDIASVGSALSKADDIEATYAELMAIINK